MLKIVELIIEYKETRSEKSASEIIKIILPMINNKVKNIRLDYREDVIQELKMNLFSIIEIAVFKDIDFPIELFTINNLIYLQQENFSPQALIKIFNNKYIKNFIDETGIDFLEKVFLNHDYYANFIETFIKFNFRNQFFYLLEKRFDTVIAGFYRKNADYFSKEQAILNRETDEGDEYIDLIPDSTQNKISFEKLGIAKKDIEFLNLFINGDKVYSQTEVAKRLGTSQQYISKRIREIRDKYKNIF